MAEWLRRTSFRVRLGTLVAAAVGVTVALAALASYFAVRHQLFSQVNSSLQSEMNASTQLASANSGGGFFNPGGVDPGRVANFLRRYNNSLLQLVDPTGRVFYSSTGRDPDLPVNRSDQSIATHGNGQSIRNITYEGNRYRMITSGGQFQESDGTSLALQIARPLTDIDHTLSDLRIILLLVSLSGVGVAVALGYLVGRATMRPVVRLTGAAEHVAATQDLAASIDEQGDDELARLARAFNSMLAALAASRQQQSQLISDAGHELRTPLTSLRTNIEVLMRVRDLPESDRDELMGDVQAQLEELTTLVGDVVDLARADEQQQVEPIEVRFDSIVAHAVERARRRAPSVTFDTSLTPGSVRAIPALLERAVLNVLDNAAKWSPPSGTVEVHLSRAARWTLEVRDHGPGIAPADLPHIFDRFYRAEQARAMPGSGLGLAIVRQVVTTHGGIVSASTPSDGGTIIHIELPIVAESEPERDGGPSAEDGPAFTPWGAPAAYEPQGEAPLRPPLMAPQAMPAPPDSADSSDFAPPSSIFAPPSDREFAPWPDDAREPSDPPQPPDGPHSAERNGSGRTGDDDDPATSPFAPPVSPFAPPADAHEPAERDGLNHIRQG